MRLPDFFITDNPVKYVSFFEHINFSKFSQPQLKMYCIDYVFRISSAEVPFTKCLEWAQMLFEYISKKD
jgi:hypothetical protein